MAGIWSGRRAAGLALLLLLGPPAELLAQSAPADPWGPPLEAPERSGPSLRETALAATAIGAANWADVRSTQQLIAAGGSEGWNPGLYGPSAERIVPIKVAVIAAEAGVFLALHRWRKEAAWTWVAVIVAGNVIATARNRRITDRLRAQQLALGAGDPRLAPAYGPPLAGFRVSFSW